MKYASEPKKSLTLWLVSTLFICAGCCPKQEGKEKNEKTPHAKEARPFGAVQPPPSGPFEAAAIAHGGVGSPPEWSDGCRKAVDAALRVLEEGGDPLDAAIAGTKVLEDDPRYNAGTGSQIRIDGHTVQMDAAVMDSRGRFGSVAVIEDVKNPVKVARAVIDTPHIMLAGDGATRFARSLGFKHYDPRTSTARARFDKVKKLLSTNHPDLPDDWKDFNWRKNWNFERTLEEAGLDPGSDTVGTAVRSKDGIFAAALSTGGTTITLRGRIGDVPILGAGLYAGPHGAVAATGKGERIIEQTLSLKVYKLLEQGISAEEAAQKAVESLRQKGSVGIIVIGADSLAAGADRDMAWAARTAGSTRWHGPSPPVKQPNR